ncbi:ABC transporter substrate-binding protein [Rhizobium rhizogenes]|uniref:ABC transporter substrate-binding protein n=1 Tax=Rhizobium rhizogenes TaxID=359 RepID=UPI00226D7BD8|nr:ABC transporter substrate-binding protein [Rhizobium rhizogenes]
MFKTLKLGIGAGLLATVAMASASAEDLVIYQDWSSPAEVAALNVLKKAAAAKGINWIDISIPHDTGSNVNLLNLVTGGNPPNVFVENSPGVYRDLTKMGLGHPLTKLFTTSGAADHFPAAVKKSITVDGEMMKIPLGIQMDGMVYYNMDVAKKAGVDPTKWNSLDAMFADFPKIKEAGFVPLALGAQQWQVGYLMHALVATLGGQDVYMKVYGEKPDRAALDSPAMRDVFTWLRKFQQAADPGSVNRDWNMTTNTVITGKALMQIHGDWMKGEWVAAGKHANQDFGCIPIPGAKAYAVSVDSWGILGKQSAAKDKAELDFAATIVDPTVNTAFAAAKGSTPIRNDVDASKLDGCSQEVLTMLKDPDKQVQNPHSMTDADWLAATWEVAFNFWSDPSMSIDDAIKQLQSGYDTIVQ